MSPLLGSVLLRRARLVPVGLDLPPRTVQGTGVVQDGTAAPEGRAAQPDPAALVDVRVTDGVVTEIGAGLDACGEEEIDLAGRFLLPGLWDKHVHWEQWVAGLGRVDMGGTVSAADALGRVEAAAAVSVPDGYPMIGFGHRSATWPDVPTVEALDAVCSDRPVILISGDVHHGWLNSAALELLGLSPRNRVVSEREWFDLLPALGSLSRPTDHDAAFDGAASLGVVGIGDMEFGAPFDTWRTLYGAARGRLRVEACTYPDHLAEAIAAGLRTGDPIEGCDGLVTMGPLKVISDGSLNTRTAFCSEPYLDAATLDDPRGVVNYSSEELERLLRAAEASGIRAAVHAIGDAAVARTIDAMIEVGCTGARIEHAQLVHIRDVPRMAAHGIAASVQPAHLWDDRDVTSVCWADRAERCFPLGTMLRAGVRVDLGSDAPVARLDPWLAMAAAVFRSNDEREQWNPAEALTPAQAYACSTNGRGTVAVGSPADLIAMSEDPTTTCGDPRADAERLEQLRPDLTLVAGRVTHDAR